MLRWAEEPAELLLEEIGECYARYRLHVPEDERSMMQSLERYGQISPVVVCLQEGRYELIDGFKRLAAARTLINAARSVLLAAKRKSNPDRFYSWALELERRCGHNKAAAANKMARFIWAVWKYGKPFESRSTAP